MQFAKDSFSMALRERLSALNPGRTIRLSGAERPALVVPENELPTPADRLPECFYLEWGGLKTTVAAGSGQALCGLECTISYCTQGTVESGVDRGRVLGELDRELFMICQPPSTPKLDFTQSPSADLGTGVFWTLPLIEEPKAAANEATSQSARIGHKGRVTVFFFPEVNSL